MAIIILFTTSRKSPAVVTDKQLIRILSQDILLLTVFLSPTTFSLPFKSLSKFLPKETLRRINVVVLSHQCLVLDSKMTPLISMLFPLFLLRTDQILKGDLTRMTARMRTISYLSISRLRSLSFRKLTFQ